MGSENDKKKVHQRVPSIPEFQAMDIMIEADTNIQRILMKVPRVPGVPKELRELLEKMKAFTDKEIMEMGRKAPALFFGKYPEYLKKGLDSPQSIKLPETKKNAAGTSEPVPTDRDRCVGCEACRSPDGYTCCERSGCTAPEPVGLQPEPLLDSSYVEFLLSPKFRYGPVMVEEPKQGGYLYCQCQAPHGAVVCPGCQTVVPVIPCQENDVASFRIAQHPIGKAMCLAGGRIVEPEKVKRAYWIE